MLLFMEQTQTQWIVFQVGSREHYAIPRMLHKNNELLFFVTDIWIKPQSWFARLLSFFKIPFSSRYHPQLSDAKVIHFSAFFLLFDLLSKILIFKPLQTKRDRIVSIFFAGCLFFMPKRSIVIFSYNYVAYHIFRLAQRYNISCILGQIDAGPLAGEINRKLFEECFSGTVKPNKDLYLKYGKKWRKECDYARYIVVNSDWSKKMLISAGIDEEKLRIIPLAYEPPVESVHFNRDFPTIFSEQRPLRVLFMGSLKLLKGIYPLLQAIRELRDHPVEFYLVGGIQIPQYLISDLPAKCHIINRVPKEKTILYYKLCDVMILPTYSDGFAITQLEAQAWKLPIIASLNCARIVEHNKNGILLKEITAKDIKTAILELIDYPDKLKFFSENAIDLHQFSLDSIYRLYKLLIDSK